MKKHVSILIALSLFFMQIMSVHAEEVYKDNWLLLWNNGSLVFNSNEPAGTVFGLENGKSMTFSSNFIVQPAHQGISTEVVARIMSGGKVPWIHGAINICTSKKDFYVTISETSNPSMDPYAEYIPTDATCYLSNGVEGYGGYIFFRVRTWAVNEVGEWIFTQGNFNIHNTATSTPLLFSWDTHNWISSVDQAPSYKHAFLGGQQAIYNADLYHEISEYHDISISNNQAIISAIIDPTINTSKVEGFFSNFNTDDNGGISSVISAPLRFINKINDTCSPYNINVLGTDIKLPCGTTLFWDKPEVQTFRNTWNLIIGAPIVYALLLKLFKVIEQLKDVDNSKVEVLDL